MSVIKSVLAPDLQIQPSRLYVQDLRKVAAYYRDIVGLQQLHATPSHVILGQATTPVLELISRPEFKNASPRSAGLFHNAIVFASRAALAQAVYDIALKAPDSYEGSADHLVSEAFYFHDPENNGLELYFDRPRASWQWDGGGVKMDTIYLDPRQYIAENLLSPQDPGKQLGHVHLRVGDVPAARKFYIDQLGFDVTADLGSALFVSVGGYHHHLAMNTWNSLGASRRDPSLGLAEVRLILPPDGSLDRLADRLAGSQLPFAIKQGDLYVSDPWDNRLVFSTDK